jgi:hypothetical protein
MKKERLKSEILEENAQLRKMVQENNSYDQELRKDIGAFLDDDGPSYQRPTLSWRDIIFKIGKSIGNNHSLRSMIDRQKMEIDCLQQELNRTREQIK